MKSNLNPSLKVHFNPNAQKVENGVIDCVTTLTTPQTKDANEQVIEVSVYQCSCGCPPCISIVQEIINREDPTESNITQMTITPENYTEFVKAMNRAYEKIISKKN
jgi:hypothetical protein